jgi:molybdenum cofactor biosynthesis protein B
MSRTPCSAAGHGRDERHHVARREPSVGRGELVAHGETNAPEDAPQGGTRGFEEGGQPADIGHVGRELHDLRACPHALAKSREIKQVDLTAGAHGVGSAYHFMAGPAAKEAPATPATEAEKRRAIRVLTVTVSDSRSAGDDESGRRLYTLLGDAGFTLLPHRLVADEPALIRDILRDLAEQDLADVLVTTGGTGIAPRDQTYEALEPLLEKRLDGFGEAFRRLSWDEVGPRSVLSRAVAGVADGRFVVALPGSPKAVTLAVEKLVIPLLVHAVALCRGSAGQHRHSGSGA